jgi:hypothetical protein
MFTLLTIFFVKFPFFWSAFSFFHQSIGHCWYSLVWWEDNINKPMPY